MNGAERRRRATEIVNENGANSGAHFEEVVNPSSAGVTFRQQGEIYLKELEERENPVAPSTLEKRKACLCNWLNPIIGNFPLKEVSNSVLKSLISRMKDNGLAPLDEQNMVKMGFPQSEIAGLKKKPLGAEAINSYVSVVKQVVASAVDEEGNMLYSRSWNNKFISLPRIIKSKQDTPTFSFEILTGLAAYPEQRERILFTLLAATGARIGECLGLEIDKHFTNDFRTIKIEQKVREGKVEYLVKTEAANREVDLAPAIAELIREFVGDRKAGFLFQSRNGRPLYASIIINRHLHPALERLGYVNVFKKNHQAGNHAFRRARVTYLKNKVSCPEGLRKFWLGHAGKDMGDLYDKIKVDVAFRLAQAEIMGFAFELPSIAPVAPNLWVENAHLENVHLIDSKCDEWGDWGG